MPIPVISQFRNADRDIRLIVLQIAVPFVLAPIAVSITSLKDREPATAMSDALKCLAMNVYWEARSESLRGREAVAHVTLNRVASPNFPDSVCAVVEQRLPGRDACQFQWYCDGRADAPRDKTAWHDSIDVADAALSERSGDLTHGALYYHNRSVNPPWAKKKDFIGEFGTQLFYK